MFSPKGDLRGPAYQLSANVYLIDMFLCFLEIFNVITTQREMVMFDEYEIDALPMAEGIHGAVYCASSRHIC